MDKISNTQVAYEYVSPLFTEEKWRQAGSFVAVVLGYNHAWCIERAIVSALEQDFPCYEVFIMDDCSSDNTLQVAQDVVRQYNLADRPIRLFVTRNETNQSASKQWYSVSQLSRGEWFGMFCGDDVSLPNRLRDVCSVISRYPTAVGVFTNFYKDADKNLYHTRFLDVRVWNGDETEPPLLWPYGCAAFWHRSLLELPFEQHNIDDYIIMWRALSMRANSHVPSLVWAMDKITVSYSNDTGVTNRLFQSSESIKKLSWLKRHIKVADARFAVEAKRLSMIKIIKSFDDRYGCNSVFRTYLDLLMLERKLYCGGVFVPLVALAAIKRFPKSKSTEPYLGHLDWNIRHVFPMFFVRYLFGLVSCIVVDSFCECFKHVEYK